MIFMWDQVTPPRLGHGPEILGKALAGTFGGMPTVPDQRPNAS